MFLPARKEDGQLSRLGPGHECVEKKLADGAAAAFV